MEDNIRNSLLITAYSGHSTSSTARTGASARASCNTANRNSSTNDFRHEQFLLSEVNGNSSSEEEKNHNHSSNNPLKVITPNYNAIIYGTNGSSKHGQYWFDSEHLRW
jgi:hypothetical protein